MIQTSSEQEQTKRLLYAYRRTVVPEHPFRIASVRAEQQPMDLGDLSIAVRSVYEAATSGKLGGGSMAPVRIVMENGRWVVGENKMKMWTGGCVEPCCFHLSLKCKRLRESTRTGKEMK